MTAREILMQSYTAALSSARAEYRECREKGLRVMAAYFRRQMALSYIRLRSVRA